jgi:hypothetical protein
MTRYDITYTLVAWQCFHDGGQQCADSLVVTTAHTRQG